MLMAIGCGMERVPALACPEKTIHFKRIPCDPGLVPLLGQIGDHFFEGDAPGMSPGMSGYHGPKAAEKYPTEKVSETGVPS
jgi:hypothetical protein